MTEKRFVGDRAVWPVAIGGTSWSFNDASDADEQGIRTIHAAIDSGVTLLDTARAYTRVDHPGTARR